MQTEFCLNPEPELLTVRSSAQDDGQDLAPGPKTVQAAEGAPGWESEECHCATLDFSELDGKMEILRVPALRGDCMTGPINEARSQSLTHSRCSIKAGRQSPG